MALAQDLFSALLFAAIYFFIGMIRGFGGGRPSNKYTGKATIRPWPAPCLSGASSAKDWAGCGGNAGLFIHKMNYTTRLSGV